MKYVTIYLYFFVLEEGKLESTDIKMKNDRNKRIRRMKKAIIITGIMLVVIPIILCIFLFVKMNKIQNKLDSLLELKQSGEIILTQNEAGEDKFVYVDSKVLTNSNTIVEEPDIVKEEKVVYLTFDDGPSVYTDDIIDVLNSYQVNGTFFVVGKEDSNSLELYEEIINNGNSLGIHTYSHEFSNVYSSVENFSNEILSLKEVLYDSTGVNINLFRFPGGSSSPALYSYGCEPKEFIEYLNSEGYVYFDWNVSSGDGAAKTLTTKKIVSNVLDGVEGKSVSVVLMHDSPAKETTLEALPIIIDSLLKSGYEIKPITENVDPVQHISSEVN